MSAHKPYNYVCRACRGGVRRRLTEDRPGFHLYKFCCFHCGAEYGWEWAEWHHGPSEPPPALDLEPWPKYPSSIPLSVPLMEGFDIAIASEPCESLGGDFCDLVNVGPDRLLTVVGDIEGKGLGSCLMTIDVQAAIRKVTPQANSLREAADSLNRMIYLHTETHRSSTLFMGLIDASRKVIQYVNCGQVPPAIVGTGERVEFLREGGVPIGLLECSQYEQGSANLRTGDVLVMCTDGITEPMSAEAEGSGSNLLVRCVQQELKRSAADIVAAIRYEVARFSHSQIDDDDRLVVVIKLV